MCLHDDVDDADLGWDVIFVAMLMMILLVMLFSCYSHDVVYDDFGGCYFDFVGMALLMVCLIVGRMN